jgi:hypothetical protein
MLENITTEPHAQNISADILRVWLSIYFLQQRCMKASWFHTSSMYDCVCAFVIVIVCACSYVLYLLLLLHDLKDLIHVMYHKTSHIHTHVLREGCGVQQSDTNT